MKTVVDPQISGAYDDGSNDGAVRTHAVRSDLVFMPFRHIQYNASGFTPNFGTASESMDGTNSGIFLSCATGINQTAYVIFTFIGKVLGIRYTRGSGAYADPSVMVDGVSYRLFAEDQALAWIAGNSRAERQVIVVEDLPDGEHHAEIVLPADPSATGAARSLQLTGLILETRVGYKPLQPKLRAQPAVTVPAAGAGALITVQNAFSTTSQTMGGARHIWYTNTGGAPSILTIREGTNAGTVVFQKSIAAGDSYELDFGGLMGVSESGGATYALFHECAPQTLIAKVFGGL